MRKWWLGLAALLMLTAAPARAQMTTVTALVMDANGERYVNCEWSVVFVGQNTQPGAGPYQPAALLVGQQGGCDSSGNLTVTLADNVNTIRPTPSQWNFSICSAPGYVPGGTFCRSNMLVTITGQTQNLTAFFQPLMPILPTGGGGGGGGYITDATPLGGLMRTGSTLGLQTTCVQGQYLGWTGLSWVCTTPTGGGGGGGGTSVTVNGTMPIPNALNFNSAAPLPPAGGINIVWNLNGNNVSGSIVGDNNPNSCLIGTGIFAACPGGGGGGGTPLPTIPQYNLYASNGSGGAQDSGAKAGLPGFLETEVLLATGDVTSQAAPFQLFPNASVEYFPTGYTWSGGTAGAAHGFAGYFSHSAGTTAATNGGIGLGGGNSGGTGNQVYLDCEIGGCDFKVPITLNGTAVGGGGGGGGVNPATVGQFANYNTTTTVAGSPSLSDNGTQITSTEPIAAPTFITTTPSTGVSMTGSGGALPTLTSGTGGLGIGPGAVPMMNLGTGAGWIAIPSSAGAAGVSSINGVPGAFNFTGAVSCASTTCNFTGGGTGSVTNPIVFPSGTTLTQLASGNGGFGVSSTGLASFASSGTGPTGTNGNWYPISTVQVNGVNPTVAVANFNSTTPAAPANGINIIWNRTNTGSYSAALVGDGSPNCLNGQGLYVACGAGGGGSGTVSSGTAGHFTWYPPPTSGTTVASNPNLDDNLTTPSTITSQEPIAAPQINVNGAVGTGIAMTGAGGTLPAPTSGQGGIGIGPGNVPSYYSNGGAWTAIGSGGVTLPSCSSTPANACVLASNAAGTAAVDTGVKASGGFIQSGASIVNGTAASSPFTGANASQEFYAAGGTITPSTGSPITFTNGAALFMGHGASTAGASGDGGIALGGGSATPTSRIYLDCEVAACDFKVQPTFNGTAITPGAGTGTVSPNTANQAYLSAYTATTGSTTVNPVTTAVSNATGIAMGPNVLQFGPGGFATSDASINRLSANVLGVGATGGQNNASGWLRTNGVCPTTTTAALSFPATLCSRPMPSYQVIWLVRCVVPWSFLTGGSGTATVNAIWNFSGVPTVTTTLSWRETNLGANTGATQVSGTGSTTINSFTGLDSTVTTTSTFYVDGVIAAPATGGTWSLQLNTSGGTGVTAEVKAGYFCKID